MPKLFISYSRVDRPFIDDLAPMLYSLYEYENVWYDENLHGGQIWWEEILRQIDSCDILIYLLSNESLESDYCKAEWEEAQRLRKRLLPVVIRARTVIPDELLQYHYVDLSKGLKDTRTVTPLYAAINRLAGPIPATPPPPLSPNPVDVPSITTPLPKVRRRSSKRGGLTAPWATILAAIITGSLGLFGVLYAAGAFGATPVPPAATALTSEPVAPNATPQLRTTPVTRNADWTPIIETVEGVDMALVPSGCLRMGSENGNAVEQPAHRVCFETPFLIDMTEVTQGLFDSLSGEAAHSSCFTGSDLPRECVSWIEADAFCRKRGARLLTEAEWEYAARGPDGLTYPWGNLFVEDNVVYSGNSGTRSWAVGSKPGDVSWVGARDLSGNVREWTNDWYSEIYYGALPDGTVNPQGSDSGAYRIQRGGSWASSASDVRVMSREFEDPTLRRYSVGFRCGQTVAVIP